MHVQANINFYVKGFESSSDRQTDRQTDTYRSTSEVKYHTAASVFNKMLSYRRETALQGALVLAKSAWKTGTGRQYFMDIRPIGLSSTTVT